MDAMNRTLYAVAILLCGRLGSVPAAEPKTFQDPNFPLIQLPARFRAQRQNTGFNVPKGQTFELFRAEGPGCVRHFWLVPGKAEANPILRIYTDDADKPRVQMRMHRFFGVLLGEKPYPFHCAAFQHVPMTNGPVQGAGFNCYLPIPFGTSCRITIETTDAPIAGAAMVDWQQYSQGVDPTPYRLHAVYHERKPAKHRGSFLMADVGGRGFIAGIIKGIRQRDRRDMIFHTGGQRWLIDGETDPHAFRGFNEEDDFGFVWGYQKVMTRWIGVPYHRTTGRLDHDGIIYRFFGPDPVPFRSSLLLECGSRADDTESVVYYYRAIGSNAPAVRAPDRWQVAGPVHCPNFETFQRAMLPEQQQGPWGDATQKGGARLAVRTVATKHAWLDLSTVFHQGGSPETLVGHAVYARTRIDSDRERLVKLRFGFDDWLSVWLNGKKLRTLRHDAGLKAASIPAQLRKGPNELLVKLSNSRNTNWRLWTLSCVIQE
jgi:hypothetical protein